MPHLCVASSKLALPTLLRSVFRTEFASELLPHDHISLFSTSRTPLSLLRSKTERYFSSLPRPQNSQSGQQSTSRDGLSTISDISSPSQPNRIAENSSSNATIEDADKPTLTGTDSSPAKKRSNNYRDSMGPKPKKKIEKWQIQKEVLKKKFKEGWNPPKKLSPDALEGIRHLHAISPDKFTTPVLAEQFKVSPEAIRRILRSKWQASAAEMEDRRKRWDRRHDRIWSQMAELGLRPPRKRSDRFADSKILYDNHDQDGKP